MARYRSVRADGYTFVFAYDSDDPSLLHIFARHLTTIDDVLRTWFDGEAEDQWNEERTRFETRSATHVLYWNWLTPQERILVITCFTRDD